MNIALAGFVGAALPEIVVGTGICVVLLAGLFSGKRFREMPYLLAMATLLAAAAAVETTAWGESPRTPGGAFLMDPVARVLKLFALAVVGVVFVYARSFLQARRLPQSDFYLLGLFALLGIMVMASAASFLTMYLGLETLALALYAMVASERDAPLGAEAAMKYFVLGAIGSGCFLYGVALVYAATGAIGFTEVAATLGASGGGFGVLAGLAFILVGVTFKFGAVPFHMWLPDVYQGAPASATLFVATAPKIGAFALALRVLVEALGGLAADWQNMLAVIAVLSLALGNLVAIVQTNFKRMLAYSTIAHVGFILLGLMAGGDGGVEAALYYTIIYIIMTAAAFGIVILLTNDGLEASELDDLRGLNRRSPWFAAMMLLVMISMIGVPPLVGFYAKWWVLSALLEGGHVWLALAGVFFSVIGAFYYLRVIWLMYFEEGTSKAPLQSAFDLRVLLSVNGLVVLALGVFPGALMDLCARAIG
ncbi:MAG: NADH-quinone oxidoreductase subunit NuoN [Gammaproteobacteria bacterium]|nr:MAG: NADH-quinone oxidoreductase subunit NuoN [Gammaproteobacteria bacterium]